MSILKYFFWDRERSGTVRGLKIMQEKSLCEKYMGKFPVISISLKSVGEWNFKAALINLIGKEAMRFQFLLESEWYCPWDVINYCDELMATPNTPLKNYWANTSGNSLVLRLLEKADQTTKDKVEEVLNGGRSRRKSVRNWLIGTLRIVLGMSGSPVLQHNKFAGAVTYVFVQDSATGYGIFAETMLEQWDWTKCEKDIHARKWFMDGNILFDLCPVRVILSVDENAVNWSTAKGFLLRRSH